jgi:hypothetical protein
VSDDDIALLLFLGQLFFATRVSSFSVFFFFSFLFLSLLAYEYLLLSWVCLWQYNRLFFIFLSFFSFPPSIQLLHM